MELKEVKDQLMKWVNELRYSGYEEKDCIWTDESELRVYLMLYTNDHSYRISARLPESKGKDDKGYLGCIGSSRKPRAGEDWTRGNDLPDGVFSYETWVRILKGIVGYELVKIQRPIKYQKEKERPTPIGPEEQEIK